MYAETTSGELPNTVPEEAKIRCFEELDLSHIGLVGGKNAALGELTQNAERLGIRVPPGFAVPAPAFTWFLTSNALLAPIQEALSALEPDNLPMLRDTGKKLREKILSAPLPPLLAEAICEAYRELCRKHVSRDLASNRDPSPPLLPVAVRSSATLEDLPEASFAGAQESFLNISGEEELLRACRLCFASLYTDRAISYRLEHGYRGEAALSIGVQEMVDVSRGASGVLFTIDTETGCREVVLINAVPGLGEPLVQGKVIPDEYLLFKTTLQTAPKPILRKELGRRPSPSSASKLQTFPALPALPQPGMETGPSPHPPAEHTFVLGDETLLTLAKWGCAIEAHWSLRLGTPTPMDIEWAWEGEGHLPAIVQARPETVHARQTLRQQTRFVLKERGRILLRGTSIGSKIASGRVRVLHSLDEMDRFQKGDILVTERTNPDWEPIMRQAAGIVSERGGRTCHAAIVSRELGVPALVGALHARRSVTEGQEVTLDCASAEHGCLYDGRLAFEEEMIPPPQSLTLKTRILLNLGDPGEAFQLAQLPCDGVGLVREEFLLASEIGIHPAALLKHAELPEALKRQIDELTTGYPDKAEFFVSKLAQGVGRIAAAFYPRPVLVRLSDLKTNEYARLTGGEMFEQKEENPMLGFRGASRYTHPLFRDAFALECAALLRVRSEMGLGNVRLLVPFCRTPEEAERVIAELARHGLCRHQGGLEIWMMCEIPSNLVLVEEFCGLFDGFSIGSNDLTQLLLGVDRDSALLADLFNERHPAVTRSISDFIQRAHKAGRPVGICGQAPSDFPDFARFLVEAGIDSISLNGDAFLKTRQVIAEAESKLQR